MVSSIETDLFLKSDRRKLNKSSFSITDGWNLKKWDRVHLSLNPETGIITLSSVKKDGSVPIEAIKENDIVESTLLSEKNVDCRFIIGTVSKQLEFKTVTVDEAGKWIQSINKMIISQRLKSLSEEASRGNQQRGDFFNTFNQREKSATISFGEKMISRLGSLRHSSVLIKTSRISLIECSAMNRAKQMLRKKSSSRRMLKTHKSSGDEKFLGLHHISSASYSEFKLSIWYLIKLYRQTYCKDNVELFQLQEKLEKKSFSKLSKVRSREVYASDAYTKKALSLTMSPETMSLCSSISTPSLDGTRSSKGMNGDSSNTIDSTHHVLYSELIEIVRIAGTTNNDRSLKTFSLRENWRMVHNLVYGKDWVLWLFYYFRSKEISKEMAQQNAWVYAAASIQSEVLKPFKSASNSDDGFCSKSIYQLSDYHTLQEIALIYNKPIFSDYLFWVEQLQHPEDGIKFSENRFFGRNRYFKGCDLLQWLQTRNVLETLQECQAFSNFLLWKSILVRVRSLLPSRTAALTKTKLFQHEFYYTFACTEEITNWKHRNSSFSSSNWAIASPFSTADDDWIKLINKTLPYEQFIRFFHSLETDREILVTLLNAKMTNDLHPKSVHQVLSELPPALHFHSNKEEEQIFAHVLLLLATKRNSCILERVTKVLSGSDHKAHGLAVSFVWETLRTWQIDTHLCNRILCDNPSCLHTEGIFIDFVDKFLRDFNFSNKYVIRVILSIMTTHFLDLNGGTVGKEVVIRPRLWKAFFIAIDNSNRNSFTKFINRAHSLLQVQENALNLSKVKAWHSQFIPYLTVETSPEITKLLHEILGFVVKEAMLRNDPIEFHTMFESLLNDGKDTFSATATDFPLLVFNALNMELKHSLQRYKDSHSADIISNLNCTIDTLLLEIFPCAKRIGRLSIPSLQNKKKIAEKISRQVLQTYVDEMKCFFDSVSDIFMHLCLFRPVDTDLLLKKLNTRISLLQWLLDLMSQRVSLKSSLVTNSLNTFFRLPVKEQPDFLLNLRIKSVKQSLRSVSFVEEK